MDNGKSRNRLKLLVRENNPCNDITMAVNTPPPKGGGVFTGARRRIGAHHRAGDGPQQTGRV